jgi:hypothetical protein
MQDYLKKDLIKVLVLAGIILVVLIGLTVWDNQSMILNELASKYF